MHGRLKEHISKFSSKTKKVQTESAFFKHLQSSHEGIEVGKTFADYFKIEILKAYRKPFTRCVEEGTYICSHEGDILNSKSEWHQAKVSRTTTTVVQGGAEVGREQGGRLGGGQQRGAEVGREQGGRPGGGRQGGSEQSRVEPEPRAQGGRADRARARGQ